MSEQFSLYDGWKRIQKASSDNGHYAAYDYSRTFYNGAGVDEVIFQDIVYQDDWEDETEDVIRFKSLIFTRRTGICKTHR